MKTVGSTNYIDGTVPNDGVVSINMLTKDKDVKFSVALSSLTADNTDGDYGAIKNLSGKLTPYQNTYLSFKAKIGNTYRISFLNPNSATITYNINTDDSDV